MAPPAGGSRPVPSHRPQGAGTRRPAVARRRGTPRPMPWRHCVRCPCAGAWTCWIRRRSPRAGTKLALRSCLRPWSRASARGSGRGRRGSCRQFSGQSAGYRVQSSGGATGPHREGRSLSHGCSSPRRPRSGAGHQVRLRHQAAAQFPRPLERGRQPRGRHQGPAPRGRSSPGASRRQPQCRRRHRGCPHFASARPTGAGRRPMLARQWPPAPRVAPAGPPPRLEGLPSRQAQAAARSHPRRSAPRRPGAARRDPARRARALRGSLQTRAPRRCPAGSAKCGCRWRTHGASFPRRRPRTRQHPARSSLPALGPHPAGRRAVREALAAGTATAALAPRAPNCGAVQLLGRLRRPGRRRPRPQWRCPRRRLPWSRAAGRHGQCLRQRHRCPLRRPGRRRRQRCRHRHPRQRLRRQRGLRRQRRRCLQRPLPQLWRLRWRRWPLAGFLLVPRSRRRRTRCSLPRRRSTLVPSVRSTPTSATRTSSLGARASASRTWTIKTTTCSAPWWRCCRRDCVAPWSWRTWGM